mgnify:CR=1 FL=1
MRATAASANRRRETGRRDMRDNIEPVGTRPRDDRLRLGSPKAPVGILLEGLRASDLQSVRALLELCASSGATCVIDNADELALVKEGVELFDADGRAYLDFTSGIAVNALGYADPGLEAAMHEAMRASFGGRSTTHY